jgi:hypothetical protein
MEQGPGVEAQGLESACCAVKDLISLNIRWSIYASKAWVVFIRVHRRKTFWKCFSTQLKWGSNWTGWGSPSLFQSVSLIFWKLWKNQDKPDGIALICDLSSSLNTPPHISWMLNTSWLFHPALVGPSIDIVISVVIGIYMGWDCHGLFFYYFFRCTTIQNLGRDN